MPSSTLYDTVLLLSIVAPQPCYPAREHVVPVATAEEKD
jgi:hypothetical protein